MHEYLFDVKLFAALRVKAESKEEALLMLTNKIAGATANLGAWPNGDPITCEISLDDGESADLIEVDGEQPHVCGDECRSNGCTERFK